MHRRWRRSSARVLRRSRRQPAESPKKRSNGFATSSGHQTQMKIRTTTASQSGPSSRGSLARLWARSRAAVQSLLDNRVQCRSLRQPRIPHRSRHRHCHPRRGPLRTVKPSLRSMVGAYLLSSATILRSAMDRGQNGTQSVQIAFLGCRLGRLWMFLSRLRCTLRLCRHVRKAMAGAYLRIRMSASSPAAI